jgi:hypothetical protein
MDEAERQAKGENIAEALQAANAAFAAEQATELAEAAADASVLAGVLIHPVGQLLEGFGFAGGDAEEIESTPNRFGLQAISNPLNKHFNRVTMITS